MKQQKKIITWYTCMYCIALHRNAKIQDYSNRLWYQLNPIVYFYRMISSLQPPLLVSVKLYCVLQQNDIFPTTSPPGIC